MFLHFQEDKLLGRTVILQNHWATEAVFKILDDEKVKMQIGRFSYKDCERLWKDSEYADLHPELLALMQKFELCYSLPDTKPENWIVPQLLLPSKPAVFNGWGKPGDLVLRFCYQFLPKGLISRLMVRQNRLVQRPELGWLSEVFFEQNKTQVLVEIPPKGDEIVLRARGDERRRLLSVIEAELDAINETFKGLPEKVTKLVPCYCEYCSQQTEPEFFEQQELLRREKDNISTIECKPTYKQVNVLRLLHGILIQVNGIPSMNDTLTFKKVFISYSKHDNSHKKTLLKHLTGLRDKIITWNDRDMLAGEDWDDRIKEELYKADVVLYLVSHNSMATDYIQNIELPLVEQRCNKNECILIPIIVDFCYWEELGFAKKNALPKKGIPVTDTENWINENQAWLNVIKGIEQLFHN